MNDSSALDWITELTGSMDGGGIPMNNINEEAAEMEGCYDSIDLMLEELIGDTDGTTSIDALFEGLDEDFSEEDNSIDAEFDALMQECEDLDLEAGTTGIDDFFEAFELGNGKKTVKIDVKHIANQVSNLVDSIIAKLKELATQFKLKYAQIKFNANMKKAGSKALKALKAVKVPKRWYVTAKKAIGVTEVQMNNIVIAYNKAATGRMSSTELKSSIDSICKSATAEFEALNADLSANLSSDMTKSVLVSATGIMAEYDKGISQLVAAHEALTSKAIPKVKGLKKQAAVHAGSVASANEGNTNVLVQITNFVSTALMKIYEQGSRILAKIATMIASLGDKIFRKASGGAEDASVNEEFDIYDSDDGIDMSFLEEFSSDESIDEDDPFANIFGEEMNDSEVTESFFETAESWDDILNDLSMTLAAY